MDMYAHLALALALGPNHYPTSCWTNNHIV